MSLTSSIVLIETSPKKTLPPITWDIQSNRMEFTPSSSTLPNQSTLVQELIVVSIAKIREPYWEESSEVSLDSSFCVMSSGEWEDISANID